MSESLRVIVVGALAGWVIAAVITLDMLSGSVRDNLPILASVPGLLLLVAAGACWLPVRRATPVDPVVALREP